MQVKALLYFKTGEIIYSRATHDMRYTKDFQCAIDGGLDYMICTGNPGDYNIIDIEINAKRSDLYNDWRVGGTKYGYIAPKDAASYKILAKDEIIDPKSFEYKKQNAIWGTYGPNGDRPLKYINLVDAETDHLQKILKNVPHLSESTKQIINAILEDRKCAS